MAKEKTKAPVGADPEVTDAAETYGPGDVSATVAPADGGSDPKSDESEPRLFEPHELASMVADPLYLLDAAHAASSHPDYLRNSPLQTLMRAFLAERPSIEALQARLFARKKAKAEHLRRVEAYEREQSAKERAEKAKMAG